MEAALWAMAREHLAAADPNLAPVMERYGNERLSGSDDPFRVVANAIVGQQISVKAATAIWKRLEAGLGAMTPAAVLAADPADLKAWGLSFRKVDYLTGLADAFASGRIQPASWGDRTDQDIVKELSSLHGVGTWTAEMVLIFNLKRPDVLPLDDIAFLRAASILYGWPGLETQGQKSLARQLDAHAQRWRPWRTVATWYLWRTLDPEPVSY